MTDEINNPAHYQLFPGVEAIDVIQATLTPEEFRGYCMGNALKYRLRAGAKGEAEKCIAKANWYQERLRDERKAEDRGPDPGDWIAFIDEQGTVLGAWLTWGERLRLRDRLNESLARQAA